MVHSWVCQQCRLHLARRLPRPRVSQLQSRRSIVSFRKPGAPQPQSISEAQQPTEEAGKEDNPVQDRQAQKNGGQRIRYSKVFGQDAPPGSRFPQYALGRRGPANPARATPSVAVKIKELLDEESPRGTKAAWKLFHETYTSRDVPALTEPSLSDVVPLSGGELFNRLVRSSCSAFVRGNTFVPTPTEVLFRYEQVGITPTDAWRHAIEELTVQFVRSVARHSQGQPDDPTTPAGDQTDDSPVTIKRTTEEILAELLSVWRLLFQRHGTQETHAPLEAISAEWKNIPEKDMVKIPRGIERNFGARLQHFHKTHPAGPELQFSAVVIFNHFCAETQLSHTISEELRKQTKPFLDLLTFTLANASIRPALKYVQTEARFKQNLDEESMRSLLQQMREAPSTALLRSRLDPTLSPEEQAATMLEFYLKRVGKQVSMQANARELGNYWKEVQEYYSSPDGKSRIPPALYNAFLSGFMALYEPDQTVKVWNHMTASGLKPDMDTWLAMLWGCSKAKDMNGLRAVWMRMLRAGVEPDERCWTTRIHGLINCSQVNEGLAALDEMGKRWLSGGNAMKKPPARGGKRPQPTANVVNNFAKPSVGAVNGAVDGIVGLPTKGMIQSQLSKGMTWATKVEFVQKILGWAGNFNIKPDIRTYNALISLYLDGNDYITAFKLLRQMETEKVEADLATHSMLFRAAFDNNKFDDLTHQEQADRSIKLFEQLEHGGVKPNNHIFSMAVDRLLKNYSNHLGVRAVMEYMMNQGYSPGPAIFTSLTTHYLQQEPPALRDLDSLVARIFGPPAQPTDMYLFDRIIEGYAQNDRIKSMMMVVNKMVGQGKRPSWRALSEVVKAFYRAGDWESARSIIRDVQNGEGVAEVGAMSTHNVDYDQFFYVIRALCPELLDESAGEQWTTPLNKGGAAASSDGRVAQAMMGDEAIDGSLRQEYHDQGQSPYEQPRYDQQGYDQYPPQQQRQYDQTAYPQQTDGQYPPEQQQSVQYAHDQQSYEGYPLQQQYDQSPSQNQQYDQTAFPQQQQYDQGAYQQHQHDQGAYQQQPQDQMGYPRQQQYDQAAYPQQSYDQAAYQQQQYSYDQPPSHNQAGYPQQPYQQPPYDQAYTQPQQSPYQKSQYKPQVPYKSQQQPYDAPPFAEGTSQMDDEFVNAGHEGYLSDAPEAPRQQWQPKNDASGNR